MEWIKQKNSNILTVNNRHSNNNQKIQRLMKLFKRKINNCRFKMIKI